jgi:hypothetical protein
MVRINAIIRDEDKDFLDRHEIGITDMIRTAIVMRRQEFEGYSTDLRTEIKKRKIFQEKLSYSVRFIERHGLLETYIKEEEKNDKIRAKLLEKSEDND